MNLLLSHCNLQSQEILYIIAFLSDKNMPTPRSESVIMTAFSTRLPVPDIPSQHEVTNRLPCVPLRAVILLVQFPQSSVRLAVQSFRLANVRRWFVYRREMSRAASSLPIDRSLYTYVLQAVFSEARPCVASRLGQTTNTP